MPGAITVRSARWFVGASLTMGYLTCPPSIAAADALGVPICAGLTIVTAIRQRDGDYESIKTVDSVTSQAVALRYSSESVENGVVRRLLVRRTMLPADLASATTYLRQFSNRAAVTIPGTTAIGTSSAVLKALKTRGQARLGLFDATAVTAPADRNVSPNLYDFQIEETIRRVGSTAVTVPVTVNGDKVNLHAIQARGVYFDDEAEFLFLDDETNPIALKYRIGRDTLDVVKIAFPCRASELPKSPPPERFSRLEQSLLDTGRAEIYSIYFSVDSDQLREESEPTLDEIADVLRRHPDWKLAIEGHTDSIAGDAYNLTLSQRRAAAVKQALVSRKSVAAARLATAGFGEARPKDTNETLEGRARNRRVELVRLP
jgi:outer membrane protein OmpA-like peptidoglycan-associated protein